MSQLSAPATASADAQATTSTSSLHSNNARGAAWASATHVNKNAFVGFNLGVPASPLESLTSMDPKDYVWGTPSQQQQQNLFQQFMQMAFFWHMAQNASLSNGNQGQQAMPMLPFPFAPMGPMNSFPFNPVMPSYPGYAPGATSAPPAANVPSQPAPQSATASVVSVPSTSAPIDTSKLSIPNQQPTSTTQQPPAVSRPSSEANPVATALDLEDAPHDCDAIESLLADAELFASKDIANDCTSYDHVGSPCSGSDGSTATADAFFQGSDSDSPASVTGDETLYHHPDLTLSDAELDAVMLGLANNSNFTDLDMDDYTFIGLDAPSASATAKPVSTSIPTTTTTKAPKQPTKEKAARKRKAITNKPTGAGKQEKRSKAQGKPAAAVIEDTPQAITEFLGGQMH